MALDPLKRSRQRQGPSLAFHTIGVQGYLGSVQPPLSEIPGSAPGIPGTVVKYFGPRQVNTQKESLFGFKLTRKKNRSFVL